MEVESKALVPKSGDAGPSSDAHNTWSPLHSTNVNILDLYSDHDTFNLDLVRVPHVEPNLPWFQRWPRMLSVRCGMLFNGPASWAFLFSLGVTCALVSFGVDVLVSHALRVRNHILDVNPALGLLLWVLWSIGMACGASAACQFISPHAQGSGIPELKTIMSGTVLKYCLSFRAGIAKALGLVLALAAGLVLGKEGPFVHLAGVICHKMCLLPCFKRLKASPLLKRQMLGAAVAAGVTAVYGTPVGGVLFSIEVTATYYLVSNLWRAFICASLCVSTFGLLNALENHSMDLRTSFHAFDVDWQVLAFAFLGVLAGAVGATIVRLTSFFIDWRLRSPWFKNRYVFVTAVATLAALCSFAVPFLRLSDYDALQDMFSTEGVGYGTQHEWKYPTPILSMMVYVGIRVVLLALSVALPLPSGLFLPVFSCGAVLGRLYGEVLKAFFPHSGILPAAYAVVGAAATTASVTHTISTAVVTLELTGQVQHTLPILVAVLMAYAVSSMVSISIYDVMLALKGLPYLATAHSSQMYNKTAQDVMHTDVPYLTLSSTYLDAERMLSTLEAADESQGLGVYNIAVVNNDSECLLLGAVPRASLQRSVELMDWAFNTRRSQRATHSLSEILQVWETEERKSDLLGGASESIDCASARDLFMMTRLELDMPLEVAPSRPISPKDTLVPPLPLNVSPAQCPHLTPLSKIQFNFAVTSAPEVFVTKLGRLVGVVLKYDMTRRGIERQLQSRILGIRKSRRAPASRQTGRVEDDPQHGLAHQRAQGSQVDTPTASTSHSGGGTPAGSPGTHTEAVNESASRARHSHASSHDPRV